MGEIPRNRNLAFIFSRILRISLRNTHYKTAPRRAGIDPAECEHHNKTAGKLSICWGEYFIVSLNRHFGGSQDATADGLWYMEFANKNLAFGKSSVEKIPDPCRKILFQCQCGIRKREIDTCEFMLTNG